MEEIPLPSFDTPVAAALYYRQELRICGRAVPDDASRLLWQFRNRLKVFELGNGNFAHLFPYGDGWRAIVPHPRCADRRDYEQSVFFVLASWLIRGGGKAWLAEVYELPRAQRDELMTKEAEAFLTAWRGE